MKEHFGVDSVPQLFEDEISFVSLAKLKFYPRYATQHTLVLHLHICILVGILALWIVDKAMHMSQATGRYFRI